MDDETKAIIRLALIQVLVLVLRELVQVVKRWITAHRSVSG